MRVIVTGGAGYIGSHMVRTLLRAGHPLVVVDDLSTGHLEAIPADVPFVQADVADRAAHDRGDAQPPGRGGGSLRVPDPGGRVGRQSEALLHRQPRRFDCVARERPRRRREPLHPVVHRGRLWPAGAYSDRRDAPDHARQSVRRDQAGHRTNARRPTPTRTGSSTRRFATSTRQEPIAESLGERHEPETHLIPIVLQAAAGRRGPVTVYGADYDTPDGTCIRDYIHVNDLCDAHLATLDYLARGGESGAFNLGTGVGHSVKQVIGVAERVSGRSVPVVYGPRREGDPARLVASAARAARAPRMARQAALARGHHRGRMAGDGRVGVAPCGERTSKPTQQLELSPSFAMESALVSTHW